MLIYNILEFPVWTLCPSLIFVSVRAQVHVVKVPGVVRKNYFSVILICNANHFRFIHSTNSILRRTFSQEYFSFEGTFFSNYLESKIRFIFVWNEIDIITIRTRTNGLEDEHFCSSEFKFTTWLKSRTFRKRSFLGRFLKTKLSGATTYECNFFM